MLYLGEYDENRHWTRTFIMDVDNPQAKPRLLWDLSEDEHYKNPGYPVYRQLSNGARVIRQDADCIFLSGIGSSPDGDRPFLDQLNLKTLKTERLFRSDKNCFERFLSFTGPGAKIFLTWHQSQPIRRTPLRAPSAHLAMRPTAKPSSLRPPSP